MLSFIGFLPAIIAFRLAMSTSPNNAFFRVYIPVLLCLPDYYRVITPGLPDPTFGQGTALAILIVAIMRGGFKGYRFSHMDVVVFVYAACVFNSELQASGYSDAQNLMFAMLFSVITPYFMAKSFIEPAGMRFEFAKLVVTCLAIISIVNLYETRFGMNVWQLLLGRFFPGQGEGWVVTFRFGMARTAGPYGHALSAGIIMMVGFRLQRWLHFSGAWPDKVKKLQWLPVKFPVFLSLVLTGGFFITFAKGSWLAGIIASFVVAAGRMKNRLAAFLVVLGLLVGIGIPAFSSFIDYASVGRANAKDDNQETACYRYELIQLYVDIALQKELSGWGLTKWPQVAGAPSIDNHYLLLFLMHGKLAFYCFIYVLFGTMLRLLVYGLRIPPPPSNGGSLAFTLASIYLGYIIAIATVYMGGQTVPMLFMLTGWAESFLKMNGRDYSPLGDVAPPGPPPPLFNFRRVV